MQATMPIVTLVRWTITKKKKSMGFNKIRNDHLQQCVSRHKAISLSIRYDADPHQRFMSSIH